MCIQFEELTDRLPLRFHPYRLWQKKYKRGKKVATLVIRILKTDLNIFSAHRMNRRRLCQTRRNTRIS